MSTSGINFKNEHMDNIKLLCFEITDCIYHYLQKSSCCQAIN